MGQGGEGGVITRSPLDRLLIDFRRDCFVSKNTTVGFQIVRASYITCTKCIQSPAV
jgi:hypothetical protein